MNLSAPFILRPVMTTFVMIAIIIAGWISFNHLPVSSVPEIERPRIQITAGYVGANPESVLNQVTIPLEKELAHVKGVQGMTSTSSSGQSNITLDFDLSKDMEAAVRDVQSALNRAEGGLPSEVDPLPAYSRQEGNQESIMYLLLTSDNGNEAELRNYADAHIIPKLSRIEGIAEAQIFGATGSIWLHLNPELMAARKIAFNQVIDTVRKHTAQRPLGSIQTSNKKFSIEIPATIQHAKDLESLHIGQTDVRLRDIGEVTEKSANEQEYFLVTSEKRTRTIIIGIQKINDGNTVAIAKTVENVVETLQKQLPPAMHLKIWFNKAIWIQESILDVEWSLLFAFLLVIIVIYLSLGRLSEALIPSAALPLSLLGTFAAMYLFDFSLDLLSLLALTLSVGFVVDDAIVVLENIVRHQELGKGRYEASMDGSKQISFTVLSMTLSLVAVFIPLLFMEGMNGRLFREFSVTLAISILISGFISLTLTPMLCSRFLPNHSPKQTIVQAKVTAVNAWFVDLYGKSLRFCVCHSKKILFMAVLCITATVPLFMRLPVQLIPAEDRGFVISYIVLPSGITAEEIKGFQLKLEGLVKDIPDIYDILDINMDDNILFLIRLNPLAERRPQAIVMTDLQKAFDSVAGIQTFIQGFQLINIELDFSGGQYKFIVKGHDFEEVNAGVEQLVEALKKHPEFVGVQSPLKNDSPELSININTEYAHLLGIGKEDIQRLLQYAYSKSPVASIQKGVQQQKIYLELQSEYRSSPKALDKLYLTSREGSLVPLKALATWQEQLGAPRLTQRDQLPSVVLRFGLQEGVSAQQGLELAEKVAAESMPSGVTAALGSSAKAVASTINNTLFLLLAAAIVMYIVLGILYESFIHPLTILSSLPFAALGGVLTLSLFNEPLSIFSTVGFLLLIGIVKKNGIMMVDYALEAQKSGLEPEEAIIEGCKVRFRPIMMTTVAAIMGAVPIAIGFGEGAEMRRGLGMVIVGGLLFAQILTLYVTPLLYLAFTKLGKRFSFSFNRREQETIIPRT
ncbi:MAG: efflux RND transporter permease subunit [Parachlamydiaceae bacterium]|nr:efflux RND transporter permease subunit [Parachlamydiaceae bacterium]